VESFSRATLASIVPIQAYDLLQNKQHVSMLYFAVGLIGLAATLSAPVFYRHIPRRWVYTGGALILVVMSACFATHTLAGQAVGMFLRILGAGTLGITLSLYIMEFIPKQQLVRSESLRMGLSTLAWTVGPGLGVWLYVTFGHVAPYVWAAAWAIVLVAIFWTFRLTGQPAVARGSMRPVNPIANIRRFLAQPRMRLAWLIAFGRSCYWGTFYVYAPILMVATGEGRLSGGLIVSLGNALLVLAIAWGRLGGRIGVRRVVVLAFFASAAAALFAGLAGEAHPWLSALLLLVGTNFAVALDAVGSTPFLRAVHAYERPQMTAVYRTNLDLSDLLPALIYSIILGFAGIGAVFMALGAFCAVCGVPCERGRRQASRLPQQLERRKGELPQRQCGHHDQRDEQEQPGACEPAEESDGEEEGALAAGEMAAGHDAHARGALDGDARRFGLLLRRWRHRPNQDRGVVEQPVRPLELEERVGIDGEERERLDLPGGARGDDAERQVAHDAEDLLRGGQQREGGADRQERGGREKGRAVLQPGDDGGIDDADLPLQHHLHPDVALPVHRRCQRALPPPAEIDDPRIARPARREHGDGNPVDGGKDRHGARLLAASLPKRVRAGKMRGPAARDRAAVSPCT
jgi:MFS family permease